MAIGSSMSLFTMAIASQQQEDLQFNCRTIVKSDLQLGSTSFHMEEELTLSMGGMKRMLWKNIQLHFFPIFPFFFSLYFPMRLRMIIPIGEQHHQHLFSCDLRMSRFFMSNGYQMTRDQIHWVGYQLPPNKTTFVIFIFLFFSFFIKMASLCNSNKNGES